MYLGECSEIWLVPMAHPFGGSHFVVFNRPATLGRVGRFEGWVVQVRGFEVAVQDQTVGCGTWRGIEVARHHQRSPGRKGLAGLHGHGHVSYCGLAGCVVRVEAGYVVDRV